MAYSSFENLFGKNTFSGHRFSVNTISTALNLYYTLKSIIRVISTYLSFYINIKVSHVTIYKRIQRFDTYFKSISYELHQGIYFGNSNEWHDDETLLNTNTQRYYS